MATCNENMSDSSVSDESQDDSEYNYVQNYVFDSEIRDSFRHEVEDVMERRGGYQPYSDEPLADEEWLSEYYEDRKREDERAKELERRHNGIEVVSSWCNCGKCDSQYLQNPKESICCTEIEECVEALDNDLVRASTPATLTCITDHPGFDAVCLNEWTLRLAADKFRRIDGKKYSQTGSDKAFFRSVSYRQFTHLVHNFLGRSKRIPIPACATNAIRSQFKEDQNMEFTGFFDDDESNS